jgi:hypothetical protein
MQARSLPAEVIGDLMRRDRILTTFGLVASLSLAPAWAAADVIPPDVDACRALQVGAACGGMTGVPAGRCQNDTCTRLDYANWNRDAMATPPSMSYACVRCVAGADGGAAPTSSSGGCSVGSSESVGRRLGPWLIAGLVWAVFLGRRRREG